jgi:hypothetical protein
MIKYKTYVKNCNLSEFVKNRAHYYPGMGNVLPVGHMRPAKYLNVARMLQLYYIR